MITESNHSRGQLQVHSILGGAFLLVYAFALVADLVQFYWLSYHIPLVFLLLLWPICSRRAAHIGIHILTFWFNVAELGICVCLFVMGLFNVYNCLLANECPAAPETPTQLLLGWLLNFLFLFLALFQILHLKTISDELRTHKKYN